MVAWQEAFDVYVKRCVLPFTQLHHKGYGHVNTFFWGLFDAHPLPPWLTADSVTAGRTCLLPLTLLMLSLRWNFTVAFLVLVVDLGDFLDGVVARWHRLNTHKGRTAKDSSQELDKGLTHWPSARIFRTRREWGGYFDAVADKAFLIPVWVASLHHAGGAMELLVLWALILTETLSAYVRTKAYWTATTHRATVKTVRVDSSITADEVGKAKQTLECFGTAFLCIGGWIGLVGLGLLLFVVPLALESVARKLRQHIVFVNAAVDTPLSAADVCTLEMCASLGSSLVVGIVADGARSVEVRAAEVAAVHCVDAVVVGTPSELTKVVWDKLQADVQACPQDGSVWFTSRDTPLPSSLPWPSAQVGVFKATPLAALE